MFLLIKNIPLYYNTYSVFFQLFSHKKEDQHIALEVGKFIMEKLNMDIYLDIFDIELQEAVSVHNDDKRGT